MNNQLQQQAQYIIDNFADKIKVNDIKNDHLIIYVCKDKITEFLDFLKTDPNLSFKVLLDIFAADFLGFKANRFEIIYNLLSLKLNNRITVKVEATEQDQIDTACPIFSSANWFEREVFDMYGIIFKNHPDLRRILTDYGFEGHPLRKDFPLTGYKEVYYDKNEKKVIYQPVKLMQEFRDFEFESPWEGILQNINSNTKNQSTLPFQLKGDEKANQN